MAQSGTKEENSACEFLKEHHCKECGPAGTVVWSPPKTKFSRQSGFRSTDIFEAFDIAASCKHKIRLIQVKAENARRSKVKKALEEVPLPNDSKISVEYWTHYDKPMGMFTKSLVLVSGYWEDELPCKVLLNPKS